MKKDKLTVPLLERAGCGNQELNGICVKGRSRELLLEIQKMLDVFAPDGDDYRHSIWIEVPRGKPSDWCGYNEAKVWADQEVYTRSDYLKEWKSNYPRETQWYHLAVTRFEGHTWLHMVENDQWWCMRRSHKLLQMYLSITNMLREISPSDNARGGFHGRIWTGLCPGKGICLEM